jgi:ATP-dependent exoDNAse (exonuclease V) alpha subunit
MLTEEMFGALLETVRRAKRIILIGDTNQLPPIGTGKPFFELVQKLREEGQPHHTNLLVSNRQKQNDRDAVRLDVALAKMFTEDLSANADDNIFEKIAGDDENIELIRCADVSELPDVVNETLRKAVGIADIDSFDISLGGVVNGEWMNFDNADAVEDWQILTPYRNDAVSGSLRLNRNIHLRFRPNEPSESRYRKVFTKYPLGNDAIVYGEKVINIRNQSKKGYGSIAGAKIDDYVANGEVGIVEKIWQKTKKNNVKKNEHEIEFSSQRGIKYKFSSGFGEEESDIELAYALTIHKAQGSGFKTTVFVLIEPERGTDPFITREMLYTALSRQSDKLYIIYNKEPASLIRYSASECSDWRAGKRISSAGSRS